MIRRSRRHICMSLVSVVMPGRARSTFAICTPALQGGLSRVWQTERRRCLAASGRYASSPSIIPSWSGDVQKTSVCIRSCPRGLAGDSLPPPGVREASNGGYVNANANLWVNHQTINDNNPSGRRTQTQASWVRKRRILSSFLSPSL